VRLFPPGFPIDNCGSSSSIDLDSLADLVDDLNSRLEHLDSKLQKLQTSANPTEVYMKNLDTIKFASEADID
jgi:prefoldin subunit 5